MTGPVDATTATPDTAVGTVVVTVAHGRHGHLARQREHLLADPSVRHVVVAMDDPDLVRALTGRTRTDVVDLPGPFPDGLPLAAARNAGATRAQQLGAGLMVFLDVDCIPGPELLGRYRSAAAREPGALLGGPVTYLPAGAELPPPGGDWTPLRAPHPARPAPRPGALERAERPDLFWSLSFAVTPSTWALIGGFDPAYVGYGGEDTDFAYAARAAGVDLVWVGGADAYHQHHLVSSPPVEHVADIVRNATVFHRRWGRWPMSGWLADFADLGLVEWAGDRLTATDGTGEGAGPRRSR